MTDVKLNILVAVQQEAEKRFREGLKKEPTFHVSLVTSLEKARAAMDDATQPIDVFVVDNTLGDVYDMLKEIRMKYPRLLIISVDEGADFALPGRADDISTEPFKNNDLITRIKHLNEDRRLQTLRADALPPVRQFAKSILRADQSGTSRQQAAVEALAELGYDYVAFYTISKGDNPSLLLSAQVGPEEATKLAPRQPDYNNSLLGWVAQNGQSRTVSPQDELNHPFVKKGQFKSAACIPVGTTVRFGVMFACRVDLDAISQENVMMLELVSAQLASALAKEARS
ncbi:MAG: GAF domain-containing protein [Anaerolineales bacterium]